MELKDYFRKYIDTNRRERVHRRSCEESATARIAELTASRRTVARAFEIKRRHIENDLHNGAQQYTIATSMKLGPAELEVSDTDSEELMQSLTETRGYSEDGLRALWRTVHGIYPQVLRDRGLQIAVEEIAKGYGPHVVVHTPYLLPELEESTFVAIYSLRAEALTNAAKYVPNAPVPVLLTLD